MAAVEALLAEKTMTEAATVGRATIHRWLPLSLMGAHRVFLFRFTAGPFFTVAPLGFGGASSEDILANERFFFTRLPAADGGQPSSNEPAGRGLQLHRMGSRRRGALVAAGFVLADRRASRRFLNCCSGAGLAGTGTPTDPSLFRR